MQQVSKEIEIQGHRGARGLWPENSLYGFEKTIALGADVLEMDVVLSGDSQVVVSHDPYFHHEIALDLNGEAFSPGSGPNLFELYYDSIKIYDCGSKVHPRFPDQEKVKVHKPLLSEVIKKSLILDPDIRFNIEIKSKEEWLGTYQPLSRSAFVDQVMLILKDLPVEQYNLQSFDPDILKDIDKRYPQVRLSYLIEGRELSIDNAEELGIDLFAISTDFKLLNKDLVKAYQAQGLKVIPWTVNEIHDMQKLIDWGVDGIITDYPDRLIKVLNSKIE